MFRSSDPATRPRPDERGIALALALFALVILGALVSGAFVVSRYNQSAAANTRLSTDAQNAAESGLSAMHATWDPTVHGAIPVWDGTTATMYATGTVQVGSNPLVVYADSIKRLNSELFLIEATGRRLSQGGVVLSELKIGQLFRLAKPTIGVNAAVTVQDPLQLNGNAFAITGYNTLPPQWSAGECDPLDAGNSDDVVGVRSAVGTGVQTQDYDNVSGFPARDAANDGTITSATFQQYLDYTYNTLAALPGAKLLTADNQAYNQVGPFLTGGVCDKSSWGTTNVDKQNLGEPFRDPPTAGAVTLCQNYFPIVHGAAGASGLTKFGANSRGQGTLLIDGDLELNGGFEWVGLIIVRGEIKFTGNGNKVTGAVLAEGVDVNQSGAINGDVAISYSKCAIEKAVGGATMGRPLGQRSWLHSY
jgi:hypothetical protein